MNALIPALAPHDGTILPALSDARITALPLLVDRAATALAEARGSAELLEARDHADFAFDVGRSLVRLLQLRGASDHLIKAALRAQGDALLIEVRAQIRLADEYQAAQERGEVARQGQRRQTSQPEKVSTLADIGLSPAQISRARDLRDAEKAQPGVLERLVADRVDGGLALTKRSVQDEAHRVLAPSDAELAAFTKRQRAEKQVAKREKRADRESRLGDRTRAAAAALGERRYGVILADPEWDFSVWSPETGMDRSAANHYPTSPLAALQARDVASIAADNCVLALWATVPMLVEAICVLDAWGFARIDRDSETGFLSIDKSLGRYVSSCAWMKYKPGSGIGMGYWFRVDHEILLLATRGKPPAPAGEDRVRSVFDVPASRVHSQKPELVCEILETYFPSLPKIELNRRGAARSGWDAWGNEAEGASV